MSNSRIPKHLKNSILVSFLITLVMVLGILSLFFKLQPKVPIFYSLARPSQHLADKQWLFLLPSISMIINLTHLMIVRAARQMDKLLMRLFSWTTVGMQAILGIALLRILIIIT